MEIGKTREMVRIIPQPKLTFCIKDQDHQIMALRKKRRAKVFATTVAKTIITPNLHQTQEKSLKLIAILATSGFKTGASVEELLSLEKVL